MSLDPDAVKDGMRKALKLLSFKPRTEFELRDRLKKKLVSEEVIEKVFQELRSQKILDDAKYARLYAMSRLSNRAMGKSMVKRELSAKGLSATQVSQAMASVADVDEFEIARELAARRIRSMKKIPYEAKKRRLFGLLSRRGFSAEIVFKVLKSLIGTKSEEWNES